MSSEAPLRAVLVRAPNWLGDCVMALPALAALRRALPAARLAVEARPGVAGLFHWTPDVDEVIVCPAGGGLGNLAARWRHAGALRARSFDAGLLLPNSLSSAVLLWRAGAPRRIGTDRNGRGAFLTEALRLPDTVQDAHQAAWYLWLAERLGADATLTDPVLAPPADYVEAAGDRAAWTGGRPYAVLAPGSAYGPAKEWPADLYAALAAHLRAAHGLAVLVTGGAGDAQTTAAVARDGGAVDLAGATTLDGFLSLLAGARCFVGNDSGAAHCAAAFGLPTVVIFGSTEPGRTRPLGPRVRTLTGEAPCAPCLRRTCANREAPRACLRSVTVDRVAEALGGLLAEEGAA
ncbi:MAG: lipopolysaccharide heptosyltransferase II [Planctomycetota bacterium]